MRTIRAARPLRYIANRIRKYGTTEIHRIHHMYHLALAAARAGNGQAVTAVARELGIEVRRPKLLTKGKTT